VWDRFRAWARELRAQLATLWFARSHPDTPLAVKIIAALVLAYALSPIDLIPDFIPVLGYVDDLLVLPVGIYLTLRLIPPHVAKESREKADAWIAAGNAKPRSYVGAAVIVLLWIALGYWVFSLIR
jgi:uncharacterized membrane protein YkvA (DUF1232 family)